MPREVASEEPGLEKEALLGCTVMKQTGIFTELATIAMAGKQGKFERISSSAYKAARIGSY